MRTFRVNAVPTF